MPNDSGLCKSSGCGDEGSTEIRLQDLWGVGMMGREGERDRERQVNLMGFILCLSPNFILTINKINNYYLYLIGVKCVKQINRIPLFNILFFVTKLVQIPAV